MGDDHMNFLQLQYFAAVVEEGSISQAARKLNISQPPLSMQIKNLEEEYGVKLFERGSRHIRLTESGELLYGYAVRMLEMQKAAEDDLRSVKAGQKASLRLGIISSGECPELLSGLSDFQKLHPDVTFRIFDRNTFELQQDIEKQRIDLAVIRTPFQTAHIEAVTLRKENFYVVGTEKILKPLRRKKVTFKELQDLPLMMYRRWEDTIRQAFDRAEIHPHFTLISDDARTCVQWAEAGIGAALVPASVQALKPSLPYRVLEEPNMETEVCLIRRTDRQISETAEQLFSFFRNRT